MTTVVKKNTPIAVPDALRRRAGIKVGDRLEFKVSGGIINIVPEFPSAADEYTPGQRRIIDERIAEALSGTGGRATLSTGQYTPRLTKRG